MYTQRVLVVVATVGWPGHHQRRAIRPQDHDWAASETRLPTAGMRSVLHEESDGWTPTGQRQWHVVFSDPLTRICLVYTRTFPSLSVFRLKIFLIFFLVPFSFVQCFAVMGKSEMKLYYQISNHSKS